MKELPKGLTDAEVMAVLTGTKGATRLRSYRLSEEAQRIIATEKEHYGIDETKALELLLRHFREVVQKKR